MRLTALMHRRAAQAAAQAVLAGSHALPATPAAAGEQMSNDGLT